MKSTAVLAVVSCLWTSVFNYKLGVVEYRPVQLGNNPFETMKTNLNAYNRIVQSAVEQGCDLIAFPEYGLTTSFCNFTEVAVELPKEFDGELECSGNPTDVGNKEEIFQALGCIAKLNSVYIVISLITSEDSKMYTSQIAFGRNGSIMARYRKLYLTSMEFDLGTTDVPDDAYFDTDFGRRVCLSSGRDIFYDWTFRKRIEESKVEIFVLSTMWKNELPFLTAHQYYSGWANANNITLMASNLHVPAENISIGSGIFHGGETLATINDCSTDFSSQVAVAEMEDGSHIPILKPEPVANDCPDKRYFDLYKEDILTLYSWKLIDTSVDEELQLSHVNPHNGNNVTCKMQHSSMISNGQEDHIRFYNVFVAYSGMSRIDERLFIGIQVCGILTCRELPGTDKDLDTCRKALSSRTNLSHLAAENGFFTKLEGNFMQGIKPIPLHMGHDFRIFNSDKVRYAAINDTAYLLELDYGIESAFSLGLYGRDHELDFEVPENSLFQQRPGKTFKNLN